MLNFYINGNLVPPPKNWKEFEIELNYDKDSASFKGQVSVNEWEFVKENAKLLIDIFEKGLTTGTGAMEGIPFKVDEDGEVLLNAYLDLTDNAKLSCNNVIVKSKERQKTDWLNDVADGFTFDYLHKIGKILSTDFVHVPYIINSVPNYRDAFICIISIYTIGSQIEMAIDKVTEMAIEATNPFEATVIARFVIYIAYLTLLIIGLIKLINDMILLIIQPIKYHAGMYVKKQLEIACAHLQLTFKSPGIFANDSVWSNLFIIPEKFYNPINKEDNRILGFTSPSLDQTGYYKGTFGDLLRAMKKFFNAKIVITENKELYLVRDDYNVTSASIQLPDLYNPEFQINANDFKANYVVSFQVDMNDKNTVQEYEGTAYQVITRPARVVNNDLIIMKGLEQVDIPFALAKRKTDFTLPEKIILDFSAIFGDSINLLISAINIAIDAVNIVIDILNTIIDALDFIGIDLGFELPTISNIEPVDLGDLITNRIGMLKIENDDFSTPKILLIDSNKKVDPTNSEIVNAKYVYNKFHIVNSFIPSAERPKGNQYITKGYPKVPFCIPHFRKLLVSNKIFDAAGNEGELLYLKWAPYKELAETRVRFNKQWTNNLIETTLYPDGR